MRRSARRWAPYPPTHRQLYLFGASGAGVTTLGRALSAARGVPYFDSDDFYWLPSEPPFTERRPAAARNAALVHELAQRASWVLGGSVVSWGEPRLLAALDLVVLLWLPPGLRVQCLRQHEHARYGDVIFTDAARAAQYQAFLAWAAGYDDNSAGSSRTLANHPAWLSQFAGSVLARRDDLSVAERRRRVQARLRELGLT